MKLNLLLLSILIIFFLVLHLPLLLEFPLVWPDESWIADAALNILKTGRAGTGVLTLLPYAAQYILWYPPMFLYLLSFWFGIFGFSITSQRYLSLTVSVIYIIIFFTFLRILVGKEAPKFAKIKASLFAFLGTIFLIIDPAFLKSSVISRPEIPVLVLITCSMMFILKAVHRKFSDVTKTVLWLAGGLLAGFAVLTHFLGGIFLLALVFYSIVTQFKKILFEKSYYFFIGALLPILVWFLTVLPDWNIFKRQLDVVAQSRDFTPNWLVLSITTFSITNKITLIIFFVISLFLLLVYLLTKKSHLLLVTIILVASWVVSYCGQIEWYFVYITPFIYIALILLLVYSINNKKGILSKDLKFSAIGILVILFIIALNNYININSDASDKSYLELTSKVKSLIPEGKTVFLSSIPDMYHAFKPGSNKLYEFPVVATNRDEFRELLTRLDFVVINRQLSNMFVGNMVDNYIKENSLKRTELTGGGYSVFVYELKR